MKKQFILAFTLLGGAALVTGCATEPEKPAEKPAETAKKAPTPEAAPASQAETPKAQPDSVTTSGAQTTEGFKGSPLNDPASPLSKRVFYFPYDSSEISAEDRQILAEHAKFIAGNPKVSVVLEGHADERGSREYNLGLGERRAQAVEKMVTLQGIGKAQLQVISFGEERPAQSGHDEPSWQMNRRVELLYSGY